MPQRRITILGCGYVGSALGAFLANRDVTCVGTTTTPTRCSALAALGIEPVTLTLDDRSALGTALAGSDAVVLTAAPGRSGQDYRTVYLDGARHLLAVLTDHPGIRRLIYTSSTRVFGRCDGAWVEEGTPPNPADEPGRILLDTEMALLEGCAERGIAASIVRLSGIYGPGRDPAARAALLAGTTRDDGAGWLNLVHRDDIVSALAALLAIDHHGVLHLNDDTPTTRRDYYDRLITLAGLEPITWTTNVPADTGKRVSNAAIKALLGMRLAHPRH